MRDYTVDEVAWQLTDRFWQVEGLNPRRFDVLPGDSIYVNVSNLTSSGQWLARAALEAWSNVLGISFLEDSKRSDIVFTDHDAGAYCVTEELNGVISRSTINVNAAWAGGDYRIDGIMFQTYLHEIGHALGLGHTGNYPANAQYLQDAEFYNDSWSISVMSYFHQAENTSISDSFAYPITPRVADIVAIQNLYGASEANVGDTVYGHNSNLSSYLKDSLGFVNPVAWTVYDTDGIDTFDFSLSNTPQKVDLRVGHTSDVGALVGNLTVAIGTTIENVISGNGGDTVIGNGARNEIRGGIGDDFVFGHGGQDLIVSQDGNDTVYGGADSDFVAGGTGSDVLLGGDGGDLLVGDNIDASDLDTLFPHLGSAAEIQAKIDSGNVSELWVDIYS